MYFISHKLEKEKQIDILASRVEIYFTERIKKVIMTELNLYLAPTKTKFGLLVPESLWMPHKKQTTN